MYYRIKLVFVGLFALVLGLSALSRQFPQVAWLQVFRYSPPQLSEAERASMRRQSNLFEGVRFILMGIALPILYGAATLMLFNDFTFEATALVLAGSVLCIGLGVRAIRRSRRD
jgi:hypothetical protein